MKDHGAPKRDGDDTEWLGHPEEEHLAHAEEHAASFHKGNDCDPDSGMDQLTHIACRSLMALEVWLRKMGLQ